MRWEGGGGVEGVEGVQGLVLYCGPPEIRPSAGVPMRWGEWVRCARVPLRCVGLSCASFVLPVTGAGGEGPGKQPRERGACARPYESGERVSQCRPRV